MLKCRRRIRLRLLEAKFYCYLLQQAEPSSGCAQHAPLLSSFVWLGVQHTEASFLGVQQEEGFDSCFFSTVILLLLSTGISVFVSIVLKFVHL
jgi:hypothetical protein